MLPELLAARAESTPDKLYLLFEEEQWTYAQAAREAWRTANGLIRLGVEMGDYVSVWVPTGPDVLRAWFGANAAGAVYAPLNLAAKGGTSSTPSTSRGRRCSSRTISSPSASPASRLRRSRRLSWSAGRRPTCRGRPSRSRRCSPTSETTARSCRDRSSRGTT